MWLRLRWSHLGWFEVEMPLPCLDQRYILMAPTGLLGCEVWGKVRQHGSLLGYWLEQLIEQSCHLLRQRALRCTGNTVTVWTWSAWDAYSISSGGLPWWRNGWESACQGGGRGFEPWSGRIPRAAERLGPWATVAQPARLEPVLRGGRGRGGERPAHRDGEWPPLAAAGESPRTEARTQHSHK